MMFDDDDSDDLRSEMKDRQEQAVQWIGFCKSYGADLHAQLYVNILLCSVGHLPVFVCAISDTVRIQRDALGTLSSSCFEFCSDSHLWYASIANNRTTKQKLQQLRGSLSAAQATIQSLKEQENRWDTSTT